ncbi:MFS transporter [Streptomyces sp. NPDC097617]|uniref:MFS transporter n=1 Tax=Streptomyces sp. NPDC097617 TaxID=3366091 RepID=UPI0038136892
MRAGTKVPKDPAGRRVLSAALFASAPAEVLDFLLPLWAGSTLHAGAAAVGALVAFGAALSLIVRPLAGELADRFDRRRVAAAGAGLYALSFAGYALADSLVTAFVAAGLGGAGGALFWVALRAWTGQRARDSDSTSAYGALLSAEGQGALIGYLVAFSLLERGGYPLLFWLGSAACAVAAASLLRGPRDEGATRAGTSRGDRRGAAERRLLPLMVVSAVTAAAEAGLWMLLLLRLQGDLELSPHEIALVFAPGFAVFVLLPEHAHRLTDRLGRTPTMVASFAASALFAAALALGPGRARGRGRAGDRTRGRGQARQGYERAGSGPAAGAGRPRAPGPRPQGAAGLVHPHGRVRARATGARGPGLQLARMADHGRRRARRPTRTAGLVRPDLADRLGDRHPLVLVVHPLAAGEEGEVLVAPRGGTPGPPSVTRVCGCLARRATR